MRIHKHNFFKNTYCEFELQPNISFEKHKASYLSKSGSYYFYTEEGVYRYSNHWGRVATCRWKIKGIKHYKNQHYYLGFGKWSDFYDLTSTEQLFYLKVDIDLKKVMLCRAEDNKTQHYLMSASFALKRIKEIQHFFKNEKWTQYYNQEEVKLLKQKIIYNLVNSNKEVSTIKIETSKEYLG